MTTVLITGANRGIGFSLAQQYAAEGAEVIACCRNASSADALKDLASSGGRVRILELDVADTASIAGLKSAIGDQPIDILINNAGILGPQEQTASRVDAEGWVNTLRVNALAPLLIAQALHDNLKRSSQKKLIVISSVYGSTGVDYGAGVPSGVNRYAYRASKAALNNEMRALARDWAGDGVLVGILDPGYARTDMTGEAAIASPKSISPHESAQGLIRRIAELTTYTSGVFQRFWGEVIPW